jgi:hypothetical protein
MSNEDHESHDPNEADAKSAAPSNIVTPPDVYPRTSRPPKVTTKASGTKASPRKSIAPKPRKSMAPKPRASLAPKAPRQSIAPKPRKSIAPKPRKSLAPKAPRNGAKTHMFGPGENPATKFQRNEDDISIPPTSGDFDEHESFFAEGALLAAHSDAPPRVVKGRGHTRDVADRPLVPVVPLERRERLATLVKGAVAVSGFLCLAALARVGLVHRAESSAHAAAAQMTSTAPAAKVTEAAPVAVDPPPAPAAEEEPTAPLKSASEEREDARKALELGKQQDAIDAAQRSITVDPTDAEAWLILGAAQLDLGHRAEAHDAFVQCSKQAKTGNTYECGAMLSWNGPR